MEKPLLVYDGGCKFCCNQVTHLERLLGKYFTKISFRDERFFQDYPTLTLQECEKAIQLIMPDGKKYSGAEALVKLIGLHKLFRPLTFVYDVPVLRQFIDWLYDNISKNRFKLSHWDW